MAVARDFFYCPPSGVTGDTLVITGEELSHMAHVMRKQEGDSLMVVDGTGSAYETVIARLERRSAVCSILARHEGYGEPDVRVTLGVGLLKNPARFDLVVEKATELGVHEIIPLLTERTIPSKSKSGRWKKLTLAAMKQCGRSHWPEVREPAGLRELLGEPRDLKLVAHEQPSGEGGGRMPRAGGMTPPVKSVLLLVGPEGGFTDDEIGSCRAAGCETVYLGGRRLRTETAAIAALALLMR